MFLMRIVAIVAIVVTLSFITKIAAFSSNVTVALIIDNNKKRILCMYVFRWCTEETAARRAT